MNERQREFPTRRRALEEPTGELDAEWAARYLRASFYYSQGRPSLQNLLFREVAELRPRLRISDRVIERDFVSSLIPEYRNFLTQGPHRHISEIFPMLSETQRQRARLLKTELQLETDEEGAIAFFILGEFRTMRDIFNSEPDPNTNAEQLRMGRLVRLVDTMVAFDHEKLVKGPPFERSAKKRHTTGPLPKQGPLQREKSLFASYVLRGEKAPGPAVFGEIMQELRTVLQDDTFIARLKESRPEILFEIRNLIRRDRGTDAAKSYLGPFSSLAREIAMLPDRGEGSLA